MSCTPWAKAAGSNSVRRISSGQSVMMATRQLQTKATSWLGCAGADVQDCAFVIWSCIGCCGCDVGHSLR
jgi:hypothetical protein